MTNSNGNGRAEPSMSARQPLPPSQEEDDAFRFTEDEMLLPGELPPEDDVPSPDTELVENERREAYVATPVASGDPEDEPASPPFDPGPPPEPITSPRVAPVQQSEPKRAPDILRLVLHESEDEGDDQKRLGAVFRLLHEQPGNDGVFLTIRTRAGESIDLALPTARLDESLRSRLREAVSGSAPVPVR